MQINNPFQMNDWEIKKFLKVVLAIQLAMWGAIGLDVICLQIPILRQLIGFIYLTFVPGIIILRILKLHKLGNIETLLYTVGLSLATLMFTGFFMNLIYPLFGISGPISLTPLIITISVVVLALCVLSYMRDKDFSDPSYIDVGEMLSPPLLFLCLIPPLAILGTYLVNFYHNNILLMLMIVVISLVVLLIAFDKFIPKDLYPLAVFVIALALLYHNSLISMYINTDDLPLDYYFSKLVINSSIWDHTISHNCNAVLSIVMLPPILHNVCTLELVWVFKISYPLLYSFIPLGVYSIFKKETNNKIAFLASFYFVSIPNFYCLPSSIGRQLIAEIFFVLLIMLLIDKKIKLIKKPVLSIIFAISLIVSHYGLSYLVMFSLIFVLFLFFLTENQAIKGLWEKFYCFITKGKEWIADKSNVNNGNKAISRNFLLLYLVFLLAWYMYISNSSAFNTIIHIGDHIANTMFTEFLSPEASRGVALLTREPESLLHKANKVLQLTIPFFISIGILKSLLKHREMKFERAYIFFSLYWFVICLAAIAIPYFAVMNPLRLYRISLFFMAPFAVIGGITVFNAITKLFRMSWTNKSVEQSLRIISVFFIILLLFNTGFIFEIANDNPNSISVSQESIKKHENPERRAMPYTRIMQEQDVFSAKWLSKEMKSDEKIYASFLTGEDALVCYGGITPVSSQIRILYSTTEHIKEGSYVYLGAITVVEGIGWDLNPKLGCPTYFNMSDIYPLLEEQNKIYTNGKSKIFLC
jgi:uncharacterized membrane protein